jgi:hypothetical protein
VGGGIVGGTGDELARHAEGVFGGAAAHRIEDLLLHHDLPGGESAGKTRL